MPSNVKTALLNIPKWDFKYGKLDNYINMHVQICNDIKNITKDNGFLWIKTEDIYWGHDTQKLSPEEIGKGRQNIHTGCSTPRFFDNPNEEDIIGVYGEREFGIQFNLNLDLTYNKEGDKGIDFIIFNFGTLDVKTARKPFNMLVKEWEISKCADYLILAKYEDKTKNVSLLGWTTRDEMQKCPKKDFGYNITNYYKSASTLHSMEELKTMLDVKYIPGERVPVSWKLNIKLQESGWRLLKVINVSDMMYISLFSKNYIDISNKITCWKDCILATTEENDLVLNMTGNLKINSFCKNIKRLYVNRI